MEIVERLAAVEEITRLKARYFRCLDTKDWAGLAGVFAPEATLDVSGEVPPDTPGGGIVHGNERIAEFIRTTGDVEAAETVHHGHMPEIEVISPTSARGVWAMEDLLRWPEGHPIRQLRGYGHYHETYERIDGHWRIATLRLTRLRVDVELP